MTDPIQKEYHAAMNKLARHIDVTLNGKRRHGKPPKVGFVLLTAEFNKVTDGRVNYISNGERATMITMLREYLARLEGRYSEPKGWERSQ